MTTPQKKRRLDEEGVDAAAGQLASLNGDAGVAQQPAGDNAESGAVALLEGKLRHLRAWMQSVHGQMQAVNRDTVFNARRLFVGGVPLGTTDDELSAFLSKAIVAVGAAVSAVGWPVTFCRVQPDKAFAFVELRSAEEASNVMALDGLQFKGIPLKIKRPSKYDPAAAYMLGPTEPDPTLDLSRVTILRHTPTVPDEAASAASGGGGPVSAAGGGGGGGGGAAAGGGEEHRGHKYEATLNTLYIGGLPIEWSSDQCMELLQMYGDVKYFRLMMDRHTGQSRGFAFAEYSTDQATLAALAALDGAQLGARRLVANRMLEHKQKQAQQQHHHQHHHQQQLGGAGGRGGGWSRPGGSGGGNRGQLVGGLTLTPAQQSAGGGMGLQSPGSGMLPGAGALVPAAQAAGGGMQQQPPPQQYQQQYQQQQGQPYGAGVGGSMGLGGLPAGGMMGQQQQAGMYGGSMGPQGAPGAAAAAAAAAAGGHDMYGGQQMQQQGVGMYGNNQLPGLQQGGMGVMGAGPAAAAGMGLGPGPMAGPGMGAGYGWLDQQQQQAGYGMQMAAGGAMGRSAQQPGSGPPTGGWQGHQQPPYMPQGSQQMQGWG